MSSLCLLVCVVVVQPLGFPPHFVVELHVHLRLVHLLLVIVELCLVLHSYQDGVPAVLAYVVHELELVLIVLRVLHGGLPYWILSRLGELVTTCNR